MAIFVGVFGSLIGSFLNVVVYRVPAGMSIVSPPSACPGCNTRIRSFDNIPVLSWLILRGRCRDCKAPISTRYPLVELGTAVFYGVVALLFVPGIVANLVDGGSSAALVSMILVAIAFLYFAAISVALALIDVDTKTLPRKIVLPSYAVGVLLLAGAAFAGGEWSSLLRAGIGLAALWSLYFLIAFAKPGAMGFGDVRLAGVIGLYLGWIGWGALVVGGFGAFILGGIYGVAAILTRRSSRNDGIPFGPWMLAAAWLGIFFGAAVWNSYLSLSGIA